MTAASGTTLANDGTVAGSRPRRRRRPSSGRWLHWLLAPLAVLWLVPVLLVLGLSFLPSANPATVLLGTWPAQPDFSNYGIIFQESPIFQDLVNSLLITVPSVVLVVVLGSMAAFAFARLHVPLKALLFGVLVLALVLPMPSIIVATFKILQAIHLYNSILGLVLVYTALGLPFAIIIVRTAFLAIPRELFEAAVIDGATTWQVFWRIYFPLARPALAVIVIWQTMIAWNDFLLPLVAISDNDKKPLTLIPLAYRGTFLSQPGALFAVLVIISIPVIIIFMLMQRYLVSGLAGSIK
ncbi:carbohydrate ABC transporter permease [Phycicoccus duodecadis]|jgi:raffinose/stachyose/melibiose transport system permease protein|uniref:Carbohydrate ABC transporter membrane protein 2 (CUT1 family) n=1 Tax=Phycicoccus duodecadis TaxID=173053 RepID=A0A2N3YIT5_9MICO|nr:carbohydrate ABC transporter permease [Phycicoccus duodecadis]PKW26749.1 carbohydrate ABC transporter membrane protein 2 (CUT1 family) [Phycicoccus duodecadis]